MLISVKLTDMGQVEIVLPTTTVEQRLNRGEYLDIALGDEYTIEIKRRRQRKTVDSDKIVSLFGRKGQA